MSDQGSLSGKTAVVTGAAGEIGAATCRLLAERGARIVAVDRDAANLDRLVETLPASARAVRIVADVSREDEVTAYVRQTVETFGGLDIFFNNAGIEGPITPITDYPLDAFRQVLEVNVVGVFLGLKHVLPVMRRQNSGSVINTASIAGMIGTTNLAAYSASKHAVVGLTRSAAIECTGTNIRVNCVCPGLIRSRMLSAIVDGHNLTRGPTAGDKVVERVPARRLGLASEVAAVVAFLACDDAIYVTGASYPVDGGRTAG